MQDIHCHILPGVDDGSPNLDYSLKMLKAAQHSGITSIICTPHCRDPYFDYERMQHAFQQFKAAASGFPIYMGFEVNHTKLMQLGVRKWAPYLLTPETGQFLLELDTNCTEDSFAAYERTIYIVQGLGYRVVIAHPERYAAIRKTLSSPNVWWIWAVSCRLPVTLFTGDVWATQNGSQRNCLSGGFTPILQVTHIG